MKVTLYCVDKDDNDGSGTETRSVSFSSKAPGESGNASWTFEVDQATFDSLTVGAAYDFPFSGPAV